MASTASSIYKIAPRNGRNPQGNYADYYRSGLISPRPYAKKRDEGESTYDVVMKFGGPELLMDVSRTEDVRVLVLPTTIFPRLKALLGVRLGLESRLGWGAKKSARVKCFSQPL